MRVRAVADAGFSTCLMRVTEVGSSLPCLDTDRLTTEYSEYTGADEHHEYQNQEALIDFGVLTNVGTYVRATST